MADVIGEGVIEITADTSGFERAMGPVVAKGDQTAKKVSGGFSAEFNKVSAAAGAMSAQVGGAFGRLGSIANSAIRPLAEVATSFGAIGAAAAGLAGGVVAIGATAAAVKGLADSALDAQGRLDEMGLEVTGQAAVDLDSYAMAMRDLGIALDEVRIALGSDVAGDLAVVARTVASNTDAALDFAFKAREVTAELARWATFGVAAVVELGVGGLFDTLTADTRAASEAAGTMREYTEELAKASIEAAKLNNEMEKEAQEDEIRGRTEARRQEIEAIRLAGIAEREEMAETARQRGEVMAQFDAFGALELESSAAVRESLLADNEAKLEARETYHDRYLAMLQAEGAALLEQAAREKAEAEQTANAWVTLSNQLIDASESIADAFVAGFERRADAGEVYTLAEKAAADEAKQRAQTAFELSQAFALGQAAIQAAIVGIGVSASMAAYSGPLALFFGASAAAAAFTTAAVAIESAPAPEFPMGRGPSPDHTVMAFLQPGEPVLSTRGNEFLEEEFGPGAADAFNRGARRGAAGTEVHVSIDPRLQRLRIKVDSKMGKRPRRGR